MNANATGEYTLAELEKLVAGAGFEPAIPLLRDYESRDKPVSR
jgi:hypothetical protein